MAGDGYLRYLLALAFVLALIGLLAWGVRRLGLAGAIPPRARHRRLALVEVLPVDAKRRLVLLRRDDVEHLVLLGAGADLLLESRIAAAAADRTGSPPGRPVPERPQEAPARKAPA